MGLGEGGLPTTINERELSKRSGLSDPDSSKVNSTTNPSKAVAVIDIPEVRNFTTEFVYNFFVPNESSLVDVTDPDSRRELETTDPEVLLGEKPAIDPRFYGSQNDTSIADAQKRLARFVKFNFTPVTLRKNSAFGNEFKGEFTPELDETTSLSDAAGRGRKTRDLISQNLNKILNEADFSGNDCSILTVQDSSARPRALNLTSIVTNYYATLRTSMSADISSAVTVSSNKRGTNPAMTKQFKPNINNNFISDITRSSAAAPCSPQSDVILPSGNELEQKQQNARKRQSPTEIRDIDYDPANPNYIGIIPASESDAVDFLSSANIIGYLVKKYEMVRMWFFGRYQHRRVLRKIIILDSPSLPIGIDPEVRLGAFYSYEISTIALVRYEALDDDTGEPVIVQSLVKSKSSISSVSCQKGFDQPPAAPSNLSFYYDYRKDALLLNWSFPTNPQRDIRRFQVFRRKNTFEPFELLKEYDFLEPEAAGTRARFPKKENIDPILVERMVDAKTYFLDEEFNKDSEYIYAIASIDAHDNTSPLSEQYKVSFDRYINKITRSRVSQSGAPKHYPNFFMVQEDNDVDLTVDSIKDSGHRKMSVYFDPEYVTLSKTSESGRLDFCDLMVLDKSGGGAAALPGIESGEYQFQIINVDRQKSKVVKIKVSATEEAQLRIRTQTSEGE